MEPRLSYATRSSTVDKASVAPAPPPECQSGEPSVETINRSEKHSHPQYQHDPLQVDEIRLLKILPRARDKVLRCEIEQYPFTGGKLSNHQRSSTPQFFCLSYTWGPRTPTHDIEVNGRRFGIRANLWQFLKQLEDPISASRYLWADAICINQLDNAEKSAQVAIMNQIFARASGVQVWVGEEADDSGYFMNLAQFVCDQEPAGLRINSVHASAEKLRVWRAFRAFLDRPYWRRAWIIQEITLATGPVTVHCGVDTASYIAIYLLSEVFRLLVKLGDLHALKCRCRKRQKLCRHQRLIQCANEACRLLIPKLRSYHRSQTPAGRTVSFMGPTFWYPVGGPREWLLDLLYRFHNTNCDDPRDKIFAFLHLQTDIPKDRIPFVIDFSRDVHSYFFEILAMYTRPDEFLERNPEERLFFYRGEAESLVNCGRLLMHTLRVTPPSLWRWLESEAGTHERQNLKQYFRPRVILEKACGFAGRAGITSVSSAPKQDPGDVYVFDILDDYLAERQYMRGVTANARVGNVVYRAEDSDVAIVMRVVGQHSVPISWAILGEGPDWQPSEWTYIRLQMLQREPLPAPEDLTGIDQIYELEKLRDMIAAEITRRGDSLEELPTYGSYTAEAARALTEEVAFAHRLLPAKDGTAPSSFWLTLDLPVTVVVIDSHFQTRKEVQDRNERNRNKHVHDTLRPQRKKIVPLRRPSVILKRPWRRRRPPVRRLARIRLETVERSSKRKLQRLFKSHIGPGVNRYFLDQRLGEAFRCLEWGVLLESADASNTRSSQQLDLAESSLPKRANSMSGSSKSVNVEGTR